MEAEATDLPELSAPARQALPGAGYTRLEHLTEVRESEVMRLHIVAAAGATARPHAPDRDPRASGWWSRSGPTAKAKLEKEGS